MLPARTTVVSRTTECGEALETGDVRLNPRGGAFESTSRGGFGADPRPFIAANDFRVDISIPMSALAGYDNVVNQSTEIACLGY
jgi:hypothetical protein